MIKAVVQSVKRKRKTFFARFFIKDELLIITPEKPLTKDFVTLSFNLTVVKVPETPAKDDSFIFPNELFTVNVGEVGKFTADYIHRSKLVIFRDGDRLVKDIAAIIGEVRENDDARIAAETLAKA